LTHTASAALCDPGPDVRKRTDAPDLNRQYAGMEIKSVLKGPSNDATRFSDRAAAPVDVFYIVQSKGDHGERDHRLRSMLYETLDTAETELSRLRAGDVTGATSYDIWRSTTYIEPTEWLHRVVRSDGTLVLPRLRGAQRCADIRAAQ
jgi:hypothetical protein